MFNLISGHIYNIINCLVSYLIIIILIKIISNNSTIMSVQIIVDNYKK